MTIPQEVIDHCNKHHCKPTCPFTCVAPLKDYDSRQYQEWIKNICERIVNYVKENTNV